MLDCAHTEARSVDNGVALVKTDGAPRRVYCGGATVANQDVNFALIPEAPFKLDGERGFLFALKERIQKRAHAVIAVAEGAGQELFENSSTDRDASGNIRLRDIGLFLRERIETYFRDERISIVMRYLEPSYLIRSSAANAADSVLCDLYARNAVHAAMAGENRFDHRISARFVCPYPIEMLALKKKHIDLNGIWWRAVLAATGQPPRFA